MRSTAPTTWRRNAAQHTGTNAGLTVAASCDWSDDVGGLYMVGVGMVMMGTLAATTVVSAVIASARRDEQRAGT
ncbi:hypothetical protein ACWC09_13260 [Streptomyces sp. NPDC001617]